MPPFNGRKKIVFLGGESAVDRLNLRFFTERILPKIVADIPNIQAVVFSPNCAESPNVVCGDVGKNLNEVGTEDIVPRTDRHYLLRLEHGD